MEAELDKVVFVKLTDAEIVERAETMAAKIQHVAALREKKAREAKATQALIDEELDELERLARVVSEARDGRRQGELFVGDLRPEEATRALVEVARHTCVCEGGSNTDVHSPGCPVHGLLVSVTSEAAPA